MKKSLYLDNFSGISGDMFLGAMLDLGVDFDCLEEALSRLGVEGYHLHHRRGSKSGIEGVKFEVHLNGSHEHAEHHHHHQDHDHGHSHSHDHDHGHDHGDEGEHHHHHHSHEHEPHSHSHSHSHEGEAHAHHHHQDHEHRTFSSIRRMIEHSALSDWVKEKSIAIFARIARAEGKVHGLPPEEVHFHEVGALDSIVDIVGACIALDLLGRPAIHAGPVREGYGWVRCAHGRFPVPTAATLEILGEKGIPITQCPEEEQEMVTPTGAAILAEFAESFGPMNGMVAEKIGYGIGNRNMKTRPNVLRACLGTVSAGTGSTASGLDTDRIAVLETNLDDCSPEWIGDFVTQALEAGALDVFHQSIHMKKNRPGTLLTVLCDPDAAERFAVMIMRQTSAFGVRMTTVQRWKLQRRMIEVETPYGRCEVKLGYLGEERVQCSPEMESCRRLALKAQVSLKTVDEAARAAALRETQSS